MIRHALPLALLLAACDVPVSLGNLPLEANLDAGPDAGLPDAEPSLDAEPVDLGGAPDAGSLPDSGAPDANSYDGGSGVFQLSIVTTSQVMCDGDLTGHEGDFPSMAASDIGLVEGDLNLLAPSSPNGTYRVSGEAIMDSFGVPWMNLTRGEEVPETMYGGTCQTSGPGPAGSTRLGGLLIIETAPVHDHLEAQIGVAVGYSAGESACYLMFMARLDP